MTKKNVFRKKRRRKKVRLIPKTLPILPRSFSPWRSLSLGEPTLSSVPVPRIFGQVSEWVDGQILRHHPFALSPRPGRDVHGRFYEPQVKELHQNNTPRPQKTLPGRTIRNGHQASSQSTQARPLRPLAHNRSPHHPRPNSRLIPDGAGRPLPPQGKLQVLTFPIILPSTTPS